MYFAIVKQGRGNGFVNAEPIQQPYLERVAQACGLPYLCFGKAMDDGYFGNFGYGNALLSRFPITQSSHVIMKPHARHQVQSHLHTRAVCGLVKSSMKNTCFCVWFL